MTQFYSLAKRIQQARQANDLYFASLLGRDTIDAAFAEAKAILNSARIYDSATTVWLFLAQVISTQHNCITAVTKLIADRIRRGLKPCSAQTGAYCIARNQLDEDAMHRLLTQTGTTIESHAPKSWLWRGHRVVVVDGTTITMPDTPENQLEYPQPRSQKPGCGFPMMRVVVAFALATGVVLEVAMGKCRGKKSHEISLFREIDAIITPKDIVLADCAYAGWFEMARMMHREAGFVFHKHQRRKAEFGSGRRLGHEDQLIDLAKPPQPEWMTLEEYQAYPESITIREFAITVEIPGFRTDRIVVHTSLVDPKTYSKAEIALLYRRRWEAELNLRSLKSVMQMDHLRCKTPPRVRNELRTHLLGYNLIRQVMAESALFGGLSPWQLSFTGTMTTLNELLGIVFGLGAVAAICWLIYRCCLSHRVGNRPNRSEPRVVKKRPKQHKFMQQPRQNYKVGDRKVATD